MKKRTSGRRRALALLLVIGLCLGMIPISAEAAREKIELVEANSNVKDVLVFGNKIKPLNFTVTNAQPVEFADGLNSSWQKKIDNKWKDVEKGEQFQVGTYRYKTRVQLSKEDAASYVLKEDTKIKVDEKEWTVYEVQGAYDTGVPIFAYVYSQEYKINDKITCTVTFQPGNGDEIRVDIVERGETVAEPSPKPTWDGHRFMGWEKKDGNLYAFGTPVLEDITLEARWKKEHTVTFDANGGTPNPPNKTVVDGMAMVEPSAPTREGHEFLGWFLGEDKFDFDTPVTSDLTLTAQWKKLEEYTVTFDMGDVSATAPNPQNVYEGEKATKPENPEDLSAKKVFKYWMHNGSEWNFGWAVNENLTLTAQWEDFKPEDRTPISQVDITATGLDLEPDYGDAIPELTPVIENGAPAIINGGFRLYKVSDGVSLPYTGKYFTAGTYRYVATVGVYSPDFWETMLDPAGVTVKVNTDTWADGQTPTENGPMSYVMIQSDDFTIAEPAHAYTVTYDPGDGTGEMAKDTVEKDQTLTLPTHNFTAPPGKTFKAWDVNGEMKQPDDTITVTQDIKVKALWKKAPAVQATISFDPGEGTGTMDAVTTHNVGDSYTLPESGFTAPAGKEFQAWKVYGSKKNPGDTVTINGAYVTVTALWKDKTPPGGGSGSTPTPGSSAGTEWFTITIDPNGGNTGGDTTAKVYRVRRGDYITLPDAPVREGYRFLYWQGSRYQPGDRYQVFGPHTFTAMWEKDDAKPDSPTTPGKPSIKNPMGHLLTHEEIVKILGSGKTVPAIPKAGVGK